MGEHRGDYEYHDDDCWCIMGRPLCNRGGHGWSCCGACKEDFECSAPHTHPTYWNHAKHARTIARYERRQPVYKSDDEIRALAPECFDDPPQRSRSAPDRAAGAVAVDWVSEGRSGAFGGMLLAWEGGGLVVHGTEVE